MNRSIGGWNYIIIIIIIVISGIYKAHLISQRTSQCASLLLQYQENRHNHFASTREQLATPLALTLTPPTQQGSSKIGIRPTLLIVYSGIFFIPVSSLKVFGHSIHSERRRIYPGKSIQALQNETLSYHDYSVSGSSNQGAYFKNFYVCFHIFFFITKLKYKVLDY